jgi:hypothetical protein
MAAPADLYRIARRRYVSRHLVSLPRVAGSREHLLAEFVVAHNVDEMHVTSGVTSVLPNDALGHVMMIL